MPVGPSVRHMRRESARSMKVSGSRGSSPAVSVDSLHPLKIRNDRAAGDAPSPANAVAQSRNKAFPAAVFPSGKQFPVAIGHLI
jgi:hypothetical protein